MLNLIAVPKDEESDRTKNEIRPLLEAIRKHLGMEIAYVSEFIDGRAVFREVDAPGLEDMIKVGDSQSLEDVYCRHILEGRLPELMADTADYPLARSLPITQAVPIGAHVSVPVRLPDGQIYGMFCCLSPHPNTSLNSRDLQVMKVMAEMAAHQIDRALVQERTMMEMQARISNVISERQFTLLYQPIVCFHTTQVVGFEALCRFTPQPYQAPDIWFRQANQVGYGSDLELTVLKHALAGLMTLPSGIFLTVNASPDTILSSGFGARLRDIPMHRLVIEVTEHAEVRDYAALQSALRPLRKAGAKLAIDDAGAGFSSFQHIVQLNPDIIKLDMSLTRSVDGDPGRQALTAALSYFAREIGCQLVAEGIETETELATLKALKVTKGQGYLLGRPMDLKSAEALVAVPASVPASRLGLDIPHQARRPLRIRRRRSA